jgi:hypothetical protein
MYILRIEIEYSTEEDAKKALEEYWKTPNCFHGELFKDYSLIDGFLTQKNQSPYDVVNIRKTLQWIRSAIITKVCSDNTIVREIDIILTQTA